MTIETKGRALIGVLLLVVATLFLLWKNFVYSEPSFVVTGGKEVLSKVHINVYMFRYGSRSSLNTIFLNGASYSVNNKNVDRFAIYVSYNNALFTHYEYDNVPRMVNDASLARNTLLLCGIGPDVFFSNQTKRCDEMVGGIKLVPIGEEIKRTMSQEPETPKLKTASESEFLISNLKKSFSEIAKGDD
ncbi:hypothetical protein AWB75_01342 [Caballeronia catudaia]|uniref:Uncharacterized protein n=1 Tax=Caballeronia catudaia TaxID=1777136 RepID=A0A157ZWV3_9BURK|nr:hypothetical protein [Caballeronia catudaia]SAK49980.1 hypothetical protein AWB75_01342 [Caballeronia catudaia]